MKYPVWHKTTPLFFAADMEFCFMSYLSFIDGGIYRTPEAVDPEDGQEYEDIFIDTSKLIADFHDIENWLQIATNGVFTIYWEYDQQILLVTDTEDAWQSDHITLNDISKTEREEYLIRLADTFIEALLRAHREELQAKAEPTLLDYLLTL